jgi:DNA (cytosine-5)-methyltransferase 1
MRVLDIYCGMGGLSLGLAFALRDAEIHGVDIDPHAVAAYNLNLQRFGCRAERADLLTQPIDGGYDIIVGGPPCQPWSLANTKNSGDRHPLYPTFQRYFDIVKSAVPAAFVFENVRGIVTQKFKPLLDGQLRSLAETYRVKSAILNAVDYGVPQKRQRIIVTGIRRDVGAEPVLPQKTHDEKEITRLDVGMYHKWLTIREAIGDLLDTPPTIIHRGHNGGLKTSVLSPNSPSYTVGTMSGGGRGRNIMYLLTDHITAEKKLIQTNPRHGKPVDMDGPSRTVKVDGRGGDFCFDTMLVEVPLTPYQDKHPPLDPDEPARAVQSHIAKTSRDMLLPLELPATAILGDPRMSTHEHHYRRNQYYFRRLTVRECMRLQSFPDWWEFPKNVSTSRRYRLVGEAVPPVLAYRIAVALGKALGLEVREPPREEDWGLPYFRRAFADYFDGASENG